MRRPPRLIEYAIMSPRQGMPWWDACHKRARPIIKTTIAMAFGMLPVALSLTGGDSSFRQPMAIVVIGGVMTTTLLSLVIIPVIFTFNDHLNEALKRLVHRTGTGAADAEPHASNDRAVIAFKPEFSKRGQGQR